MYGAQSTAVGAGAGLAYTGFALGSQILMVVTLVIVGAGLIALARRQKDRP